jgi:hypothetical protein
VVQDDDGKTIKKPNKDYGKWVACDQQVMGDLLMSISKDVLTQVADKETVSEVWKAIHEMLTSQSRARSINTRIALTTMKKGDMTMSEYFTKMKFLTDNMAAVGKPLDDEELIRNILTGIDEVYNPVVTVVAAQDEAIMVSNLYTQLLSFDQCLDLLYGGTQQSSANSASRGGRVGVRGNFTASGGNRGGNNNGGHQGRSGGGGRGNGGRGTFNSNSISKPKCQVCFKGGHTSLEC